MTLENTVPWHRSSKPRLNKGKNGPRFGGAFSFDLLGYSLYSIKVRFDTRLNK